jgi:putative inorganic carbon (hco3(-)) transporter
MLHFGMEGTAPFLMYWTGVLCFFLALFWRPSVGLYYLLPLIPVQTVRYWLNPFPFGSSVVDLMMLAIFAGLLRRGDPIIPETPLTKLLVGLVFYSYISLWLGALFLGSGLPFWIDNPRVVDWKNYVTLPLLFWLAYSSLKTPAQMKIALVCMMFSVLMLDRSFFDGIQGRDMSTFSESNRIEGAMGYAGVNGLAAFQAQLIVCLMAMAFWARNYLVKLLYLAVGAFSLYCLMFAFSRGGYAGFLVGVLFLGVVKKRSLLAVMALFLAGWQEMVPAAVAERVMMTTDSSGQLEHSAELRVGMWDEAMEIFNQNPVTGTGMFTYFYRGGQFRNPHNYYVQVMVESGSIGMAFFLILLWRLFSMGMQLAGTDTDPFLRGLGLGLAAWITAAAATNFFGDRWTYFQVSGFMWTLAAMVARGLAIHNEEIANEELHDQEWEEIDAIAEAV